MIIMNNDKLTRGVQNNEYEIGNKLTLTLRVTNTTVTIMLCKGQFCHPGRKKGLRKCLSYNSSLMEIYFNNLLFHAY